MDDKKDGKDEPTRRNIKIENLTKPAEDLTAEEAKGVKGGLVGDLGLLSAKPRLGTGPRRPSGKRTER